MLLMWLQPTTHPFQTSCFQPIRIHAYPPWNESCSQSSILLCSKPIFSPLIYDFFIPIITSPGQLPPMSDWYTYSSKNAARQRLPSYCIFLTHYASDDVTDTVECIASGQALTSDSSLTPHRAISPSVSTTAQYSSKHPLRAKGLQIVLLSPGNNHCCYRYRYALLCLHHSRPRPLPTLPFLSLTFLRIKVRSSDSSWLFELPNRCTILFARPTYSSSNFFTRRSTNSMGQLLFQTAPTSTSLVGHPSYFFSLFESATSCFTTFSSWKTASSFRLFALHFFPQYRITTLYSLKVLISDARSSSDLLCYSLAFWVLVLHSSLPLFQSTTASVSCTLALLFKHRKYIFFLQQKNSFNLLSLVIPS